MIAYFLGLYKAHKIKLIPEFFISIAECYTHVLYTSTHFYGLYFTTFFGYNHGSPRGV